MNKIEQKLHALLVSDAIGERTFQHWLDDNVPHETEDEIALFIDDWTDISDGGHLEVSKKLAKEILESVE
jgi:hypothetical protein